MRESAIHGSHRVTSLRKYLPYSESVPGVGASRPSCYAELGSLPKTPHRGTASLRFPNLEAPPKGEPPNHGVSIGLLRVALMGDSPVRHALLTRHTFLIRHAPS